MCLMFSKATLLIKPVKLFFKASQLILWYSKLPGSVAAASAIKALNLAGGM